MTAMQLFNEILFIITFLVLIVAMAIQSIVAILRYRGESHRMDENGRRIEHLELRIDAFLDKQCAGEIEQHSGA